MQVTNNKKKYRVKLLRVIFTELCLNINVKTQKFTLKKWGTRIKKGTRIKNLLKLITNLKFLNKHSPLDANIVFVSTQLKGVNKPMKVKRPLGEQKNMFGARIKIMWEDNLLNI